MRRKCRAKALHISYYWKFLQVFNNMILILWYSLSFIQKMLPKDLKKYKIKYLGWLQGENKKLHKISGDKNLTESVHRWISHPMWNFAWCAKFFGCFLWFCMVYEISHSVRNSLSLNLALCPTAAPLDFACYAKFSHRHAKLLHVGFLPLVFFLASLIGLATYFQAWKRAMKCFKAWILPVFEL